MIPSDIKLFTWVDVEEVLSRIPSSEWPEWLVSARAYWDGLTLEVVPQASIVSIEWLSSVFAPRFQSNSDIEDAIGQIILESRVDNVRVFPVFQEITYDTPRIAKFVPSLRRPTVLSKPSGDIVSPILHAEDLPPVVAFHSFKGGVGRTIQAIAFAQSLVKDNQQVLLIDGDLEAPSISWLLQSRLPDAPVALSDFLALAHGDCTPNRDEAIHLTADRLKDAQIDGIYVLPAFRSMEQYAALEIRPEHLLQGSDDPFILTILLARLGKILSVDVVVIDLRAGLSELAAGLLFDPNVYRVLVTTLGDQSVGGTKQVLQLISNKSLPKAPKDPLPAIIFTQVTPDSISSDLFSRQQERLAEASSPFLEGIEQPLGLPTVTSMFDTNLLALPSKWEEAFSRIERAGIADDIRILVTWLPDDAANKQMAIADSSEVAIKSQREDLAKMARTLVYAERGEGTEFLATAPLRNLASDHRRSVPISVIVGAKGAGKTYTFLQVIRRKNWDAFASEAQATEVQVNALICPVLESINLEERTRNLVQEVKKETSQSLGLDAPLSAIDFRNVIRDHIQETPHEGQWRKYWLDAIAWSVGLEPNEEGAGSKLVTYLTTAKKKLVIVIDD